MRADDLEGKVARVPLAEAAEVFAQAAKRRTWDQDLGRGDLFEDVASWHHLGLLNAPLSETHSGASLGHGQATVDLTLFVLATMGGANLPLARL